MDWIKVVWLTQSPLEVIVRGTLIFLGLTAMVRLSGRRQTGQVSTADLIVIVVIADAVQNGMAGEQKSVADALLLAATIMLWDWALDWLAYRSPWVARLLRPAPLLLIQDGKVLRQNLRRELVTMDELKSMLREHDIEDPAEVKRCFLEGDGHLSVISKEGPAPA